MKHLSKTTSLILFLLSAIPVIAQHKEVLLTGIIKDSLSKQPLPHATIQLKSYTDTAWSAGGTSNAKGIFVINNIPAGLYRLEVHYIGYKDQKRDSLIIEAGNTPSPLQIQLTLATATLKTVTVATSKPYIVLDADKIVLNVAESPIAAGGNAYEVLLRSPGVIEQQGSIMFRGKTVNILINGRPSNFTGEDLKNMLTSMPANGIDKIELIPNPSARYDAQGGAVINIRLAKNKNDGTNGTLTTGIGTGRYIRYNSGLNMNHRNKKVNIYGSYDYQHNAQYYDNRSERLLNSGRIFEDEYERRYRNNHSYKLGLDHDINKRNMAGILVKGFVNFRDRKAENTSTFDHPVKLTDSSSKVFTNGYARFMSPSVNIFFKTLLNTKGAALTVNADYFRYRKTWRNDYATWFYDENNQPYPDAYQLKDQSPANITVQSASIDYTHPSAIGKWEVGIKTTFTRTDNNIVWEYQEGNGWKTDAGKTNHFIYREHINAAYITYNKQFKKKYNVQLGVRAEHTSTKGNSITQQQVDVNNYVNFFPTASINYAQSVTRQWTFSYRKSINRYGFSFVNPAITYQSPYTYAQGNPWLKPQLDHSFELSHIYKYQLFTSLSYVHSVKALAPVYRQAGNVLISSYDNLGSYDIVMLTVTLNKTVKKKWTSVTTVGEFYIDVDARDQVTSGSGNKAFTTYISSQNTLRLPKQFTLELFAMYRSAFASGIYKVNAYFTLNAGISKSILKGKGTLKCNVTDILNTQRFSNRVENYQRVTGVFINKAETRFANLVFTWRFGNKNVKAEAGRKTGIEDVKNRTGAQ